MHGSENRNAPQTAVYMDNEQMMMSRNRRLSPLNQSGEELRGTGPVLANTTVIRIEENPNQNPHDYLNYVV